MSQFVELAIAQFPAFVTNFDASDEGSEPPVLLENRVEILHQARQPSGLTGRIKGSIIHRMSTRSLSANQLAALSALIATPATKAKASITLSGNLLKVIDSLAGAAQRSAWIERAVQSYATRQLKERRRERELVLLNRHADALNAEGDDSATYQANWTAE